MKIAKYIGNLIYDYECVVIPGLGGFISSQKSADINKVTHQFKPPVKEIHFNTHLKANDGLLVNYVARNEQISYKQSKQKVDKFVLLCHNALNSGKRINFNKIGYIFCDADKNIVFKQDNSVNYNAESFGLTSFISPAIRRPSDEDKLKEVFTKSSSKDIKPESKSHSKQQRKEDRRVPAEASRKVKIKGHSRPSKAKQQLLFVFVILFAMGSYYVFNKRDSMLYYWNVNKHMVPFLYNHPNDYLSANAGHLHLDKFNVSTAGWLSDILTTSKPDDKIIKEVINNEKINLDEIETTENDFNSDDVYNSIVSEGDEPAIETETPTENQDNYYHNGEEPIVEDYTTTTNEVTNPVIEETTEPSYNDNYEVLNTKYFIIAGSFGSRRNAERLVNKLRDKGFDALVADTNSRGMFRVAFMGFVSLSEANQRLLAIRRETKSKAWILKK